MGREERLLMRRGVGQRDLTEEQVRELLEQVRGAGLAHVQLDPENRKIIEENKCQRCQAETVINIKRKGSSLQKSAQMRK
jgi:hypothetical protein